MKKLFLFFKHVFNYLEFIFSNKMKYILKKLPAQLNMNNYSFKLKIIFDDQFKTWTLDYFNNSECLVCNQPSKRLIDFYTSINITIGLINNLTLNELIENKKELVHGTQTISNSKQVFTCPNCKTSFDYKKSNNALICPGCNQKIFTS